MENALAAVVRVVGCGQNREHPRTRARLLYADRANARMRMRRAQHIGEAGIGRGNIVGVAAVAGDETLVLEPRDRLADVAGHFQNIRPVAGLSASKTREACGVVRASRISQEL